MCRPGLQPCALQMCVHVCVSMYVPVCVQENVKHRQSEGMAPCTCTKSESWQKIYMHICIYNILSDILKRFISLINGNESFHKKNGCKGAVTVCKYTLWVSSSASEVRKRELKVPEMKYWVK